MLDCAVLPFAPGIVPESLHDPVAAAAFLLAGRRARASWVSGHGAKPAGFLSLAAFCWACATALSGGWAECAHSVGSFSLAFANLSACTGCRHAPADALPDSEANVTVRSTA